MYLRKNYRALINESSTRKMINKNLNLAPHSGNVTEQTTSFRVYKKLQVSTWSNDEIIVARFAF